MQKPSLSRVLLANHNMSFAEYREILRYEIDKAEGEIIKSNNVENKQALKEDFESQYSRSLLVL